MKTPRTESENRDVASTPFERAIRFLLREGERKRCEQNVAAMGGEPVGKETEEVEAELRRHARVDAAEDELAIAQLLDGTVTEHFQGMIIRAAQGWRGPR